MTHQEPNPTRRVLAEAESMSGYAERYGEAAMIAMGQCRAEATKLMARGALQYAPNADTEPMRRAMRALSLALAKDHPELFGKPGQGGLK